MSIGSWYSTTPLFLLSSFFSKFLFLTFFPFFAKKYKSPSITFQKKRKKCSQKENTGKKEAKWDARSVIKMMRSAEYIFFVFFSNITEVILGNSQKSKVCQKIRIS